MTLEIVILSLLVLWTLVGFAVFWRVTNATVSFTWAARTCEPEPAKLDARKLRAERDEAREMAGKLRAELEGRT